LWGWQLNCEGDSLSGIFLRETYLRILTLTLIWLLFQKSVYQLLDESNYDQILVNAQNLNTLQQSTDNIHRTINGCIINATRFAIDIVNQTLSIKLKVNGIMLRASFSKLITNKQPPKIFKTINDQSEQCIWSTYMYTSSIRSF